MSYTVKRVILLVMAWGLIVFTGLQVRANLTDTPPVPAVAPGPTATPDEETALQQTLERNPGDVTAMAQLAQLLYDQGDYEGAGLLYERAVQVDPHNPDLLLQLAATQLRRVQLEEARATLQQAILIAPDRPDILLLLGLTLSKVTPPDLAGAATAWRQVIQLAPGTDLARQAQDLLNDLTPTPAK
jgi:cytochrome c-type biogenesis protein CcmH/NrfG